MYRFLIASVGPLEADDCFQETWLAALRAYPGLKDGANLRGWVLTIANRKAIDHVRARSRRAVPVAQTEDLAPVASGSPAESDGAIWTRVAQLPDKQRTALALRYVADAAYSEIASMMQTSEAAARRNVHEGLKKLREEYADE